MHNTNNTQQKIELGRSANDKAEAIKDIVMNKLNMQQLQYEKGTNDKIFELQNQINLMNQLMGNEKINQSGYKTIMDTLNGLYVQQTVNNIKINKLDQRLGSNKLPLTTISGQIDKMLIDTDIMEKRLQDQINILQKEMNVGEVNELQLLENLMIEVIKSDNINYSLFQEKISEITRNIVRRKDRYYKQIKINDEIILMYGVYQNKFYIEKCYLNNQYDQRLVYDQKSKQCKLIIDYQPMKQKVYSIDVLEKISQIKVPQGWQVVIGGGEYNQSVYQINTNSKDTQNNYILSGLVFHGGVFEQIKNDDLLSQEGHITFNNCKVKGVDMNIELIELNQSFVNGCVIKCNKLTVRASDVYQTEIIGKEVSFNNYQDEQYYNLRYLKDSIIKCQQFDISGDQKQYGYLLENVKITSISFIQLMGHKIIIKDSLLEVIQEDGQLVESGIFEYTYKTTEPNLLIMDTTIKVNEIKFQQIDKRGKGEYQIHFDSCNVITKKDIPQIINLTSTFVTKI